MQPLDQPEKTSVQLQQPCIGQNGREPGCCGFILGLLGILLLQVGWSCVWHGGAILLDCWGVTHSGKPGLRSMDHGLSTLGIGAGAVLVFFAIVWTCEKFGIAVNFGGGDGGGGDGGDGGDCGGGDGCGGDC